MMSGASDVERNGKILHLKDKIINSKNKMKDNSSLYDLSKENCLNYKCISFVPKKSKTHQTKSKLLSYQENCRLVSEK